MSEDIFHLGIKALIINSRREILLLRVNPKKLINKKEKGLIAKAYWDIPGGRIEKGSTPEDTLKREIYEETGIEEVQSFSQLMMVLSNIRVPHNRDTAGLILSIYICKVKNIDNIKLSNEHTDAEWFLPQKAASLLKTKYPNSFIKTLSKL